MSCDTLHGLRTIRLLGELGHRFGREHHFAVGSPAEALRALGANCPGFRVFLSDPARQAMRYQLLVGETPLAELEDGLQLWHGMQITYTIAPVLEGAKDSGLGRIFSGIAMVAAAWFTKGASLSWGGYKEVVSAAGLVGFSASMGTALVLGGVAQLIAPTPNYDQSSADSEASSLFAGPVNTTAQGGAVPLLYGRLTVGSAVISAGIQSQDVPV
ncbi:tail assembly protein [Jeongeupia naejangsanensis]|uniref:Tail assembly protein n=1 Tax=Jeongeupia naejangsanensis TaxID=613195 RepID=A0ABS2BG14_9NEIS|nr:tail assembly protein [Jeongeupia naejangsanensis]MBM3114541.1 tail assembly protein [Jeongeupia naejangsanensis]